MARVLMAARLNGRTRRGRVARGREFEQSGELFQQSKRRPQPPARRASQMAPECQVDRGKATQPISPVTPLPSFDPPPPVLRKNSIRLGLAAYGLTTERCGTMSE
jgi:hypothetical protein